LNHAENIQVFNDKQADKVRASYLLCGLFAIFFSAEQGLIVFLCVSLLFRTSLSLRLLAGVISAEHGFVCLCCLSARALRLLFPLLVALDLEVSCPLQGLLTSETPLLRELL
jgi:hypothetical protein